MNMTPQEQNFDAATPVKFEITGTREMRYSAVKGIFESLKYNDPMKPFKKFFNANSKDGETHALMDLDHAIWHEFLLKADGSGQNYRRPDANRVRFCGTIPNGHRIVVPYNPKQPKAISIELWRNKEVLTIKVEEGEQLKMFGRILYKLGGNPNAWKEPVEISGEVLKMGHWMAAYICRAMDDEVGYMMYHDEGSDKL